MIYVSPRGRTRKSAALYQPRPRQATAKVTASSLKSSPRSAKDTHPGFPHDQVIQHLDLDQGEGVPDAPGDQPVGLAGLGRAGGVIVGQDHGDRSSGPSPPARPPGGRCRPRPSSPGTAPGRRSGGSARPGAGRRTPHRACPVAA